MNLDRALHQPPRQLEILWEPRGEAPERPGRGEARSARQGEEPSGPCDLLAQIVAPRNVEAALKRVRQNRGGAGVDGMSVEELPEYLASGWERIRQEILSGHYQPQPVLQQKIPKKGGGVRELGIPTVLDRLIQQSILQVLQPQIDPTFSQHSYGFRPGRRALDAVRQAQSYIEAGYRWVVDVDLEKFFDRVHHDVLMGRLARRIADRRLLGLIRRYLRAGILAGGVTKERYEGTPQGGPLSPLLANVLLDEVDQELERRGHRFVRYADDSNVYVKSKRAGERVLESLRRLYGRLRLRINETKSAVSLVWSRRFLGYGFWLAPGGQIRKRVSPQAEEELKVRVREITSRQGGRSLEQVIEELRSYLPGWWQYFRLADMPGVFRDLDSWIRRRLRQVQVKHWKRGPTAYRELRARGVAHLSASEAASHVNRWWMVSRHPALHTAFPTSFFDRAGLPRLAR